MANPTFTYNGHTYSLTDSSLTWQQAQDQAVSLGGNLVTINDAAEQAWLIATFTEGGWIGYTDQATEGVFQWISGETATYTNWYPGEPNDANGNEDYAQIFSSGLWNDNNGNVQLAGIIEINNPVNNPPTLTAFSAPVSTGNEDSEITVSFADLQAKGNEADVDGTVNAFVVKAVSSGVLKIGLSAAMATAWNALSNNTIDATHQAYWTPDSNVNGTLDAFTVVAQDNGGLESATPVQASVDVTAVPDVNVTAGATPVEGGATGTFVINLDSPAPVGGLTVNYTLAGTATLATDYTVTAGSHITVVTGSSFTIAAGETSAVLNVNALSDAVLDPNETVTLNLTTGTGYQLALGTTATLTITDINISENHAPILSTPEAISYTDTAFVDNFAVVTGVLVANDIDGDGLTYGIEGSTDNGLTVSKSNAYGELTVTKTTGAYSFVPNSAAIEPLIVNVADSFTVTVSDGQLSDSKTLLFTITQNGNTESVGNDKLIGTAGNDVFNGLAGDDIIKSLAGDDTIDGGAGADRMLGGKGNDTYYVDNVGDVVKERAWQGNDTVYSSIAYTLSANVENLYLNLERASSPVLTGTGNSLDNYLKADGRMDISAHAILDGQAGDDILDSNIRSTSTLLGGEGNDLYYVYNEGDVVIEFAGEGEDTVSSSIASYTLTANVENLILRHGPFGDVGISGTGNALANHLTSDIVGSQLAGLGGDDNYYVGNESVTIVESAHNGWDSVLSTTNRTLEANVEELYLLGTDNLNGTGNDDADNNLNGNAGDNILDGKGGRDLLRGKAGNDTLIGGEGEDTLIGGLGKDTYHLSETTATTDTVQIAKGDSLVSSYDIVNDFKLGVGSNPSRAGVDKLDLASNDIAHNVNRSNGTDSGIIESHHINKGIISFDDIDRFTTPLTITETNLADVFGYLQANISGHETVAFVSEGNTFVFQDGGATDTLVELVGVTASSLSTTGSAAGSVWIV